MSTLRVQRSEMASVLHVSEGEVRGEGWEVRLGDERGGDTSPLPRWHPGLPLQIWHITLKRPQACVHIGNENALEERESQRGRTRETESVSAAWFYCAIFNTSRCLNEMT